jgi:hypothetical protein
MNTPSSTSKYISGTTDSLTTERSKHCWHEIWFLIIIKSQKKVLCEVGITTIKSSHAPYPQSPLASIKKLALFAFTAYLMLLPAINA